MKNKKFLYVLIPAVIIVWGLITHKVIAYFMDDGSSSFLQYNDRNMTPHELKRDTFSLMANYSDPFRLNENQDPTTKKGKTKMKPKSPWPKVTFYGAIRAEKKKNSVASLSINNRNMIMKTGDTCQGIKLTKISASSVSLRFKGEKKEFSLKQDRNNN